MCVCVGGGGGVCVCVAYRCVRSLVGVSHFVSCGNTLLLLEWQRATNAKFFPSALTLLNLSDHKTQEKKQNKQNIPQSSMSEKQPRLVPSLHNNH